jgi:hypothetical protein
MKKLLNYQQYAEKNYEAFKQAVTLLINEKNYCEEKKDYLYNKYKAKLYNIYWDDSVYDPVGLEQLIDSYEWNERKNSYNQDKDYYDSIRVK